MFTENCREIDLSSNQRSAILRPASNSNPTSRKPSGLSHESNEPDTEELPVSTSAPGSPAKKVTGSGTIRLKAKSNTTPAKGAETTNVASDDLSAVADTSDFANDSSPTWSEGNPRNSIGSSPQRLSVVNLGENRLSMSLPQQPRISIVADSTKVSESHQQAPIAPLSNASPSDVLDAYSSDEFSNAADQPIDDAITSGAEEAEMTAHGVDGQQEVELAVALADYESTGEGQLGLVAGETIRVLVWEYGNGWSYGESIDGSTRGVFPQT